MTATAEISLSRVRTRRSAGVGWLVPLALMAVALAVRVPHLARQGYELDEMWAAEVAVGRGSPHVTLPTDRLLWPAPALARLAGAPPLWHVWTHIDATHPPLYEVLLRLWEDAFGTGDGRERALSVVASVVAVGLLYDAVRVRAGPGAAFWAAALMAAAAPQVEYARLTRSYAPLMAISLAMADAVTRIDVLGPNRRRVASLAAAAAATLLTHYFAVAVVAATAVYGAACLRGPRRRAVLVAVGIGAAAFAVTWGPMIPGQLHLFRPDDPATDFLRHDVPHHAWHTLLRAALVPLSMLFAPTSTSVSFAAAGGVLYLLPMLIGRGARRLTFWWLWLCGTVGFLAVLDLARGTTHLFYVRYSLLAGPAVFALLPMTLAAALDRSPGLRWLAHAVPAAAVVAALAAVWSDAYVPQRTDPKEVVATFDPPLGRDDLLVLTTPPETAQFTGGLYMMVDRYAGPLPCPAVVLTGPASATVMDRIRRSRHVWMLSDAPDWRPYLPGVTPVGAGRLFPGIGLMWHVAGPSR